jgi:replicative DNA helicase
MTSGLQNGEMIIISARQSMGKTALALNIAEHVGADTKQPVAVFSLEMSKQQLAQRLLCSRSGVDSQRLRRNVLSQEDWERLQSAVGQLSDAPIYIDDTPGLSLLALRAKARRLAARYHIKLVVVDYLQLMSAGGRVDSREQEVSMITRGIKALARELAVPVICLSQLNRSPESREGHRPRMSDLRESGSIEQDADVVLMLHREDYYHRGEKEHSDTNTAELIVSKQRNGPTGTVELYFNSSTTRFGNLKAGGGY